MGLATSGICRVAALLGAAPVPAGWPWLRSASRVHPRSRQGGDLPERAINAIVGPSPLAWGSPTGRRPFSTYGGVHPQRAWEPHRCKPRSSRHAVHPRSRGRGGMLKGIMAEPDEGPSPLARGSCKLLQRGEGVRLAQRRGKPGLSAGATALALPPLLPRSGLRVCRRLSNRGTPTVYDRRPKPCRRRGRRQQYRHYRPNRERR